MILLFMTRENVAFYHFKTLKDIQQDKEGIKNPFPTHFIQKFNDWKMFS